MSILHKVKFPFLGLATAAGLCAATPARAALIANGDFETGSLSGWTATGLVAAQATPYFGFNHGDYGSYFAVLNAGTNATPNGVLSQTISTVAGTNYVLVFDYGANGAGQSVTASAFSGIGDLLATELVSSNTPARQAFLLNFAAISSSTTIKFTDNPTNNTYNADGGIDNVSVTASVPEPGSLALLCLGAAGVVTARRRGRKAA
ncbi:MAG: PEP-CTERM sorting domain-containing protein [Acetobacteraceae bacterium]|nr:PEP-CTERM sorting domain-containing protein [Acetobacteraceae bacterium]